MGLTVKSTSSFEKTEPSCQAGQKLLDDVLVRKLGFFTWISPCKKLDQRLAKLYDLTMQKWRNITVFLEHVETFQHGKSLVICSKSFNSLWIDPLENLKNSKSQVELVAIWLWKWGIPRIPIAISEIREYHTMINQRICLENIFSDKTKKKLPQNSMLYAAPTSCWAFSGDTCKTQSGRTNDSWWWRLYSQKWLRKQPISVEQTKHNHTIRNIIKEKYQVFINLIFPSSF